MMFLMRLMSSARLSLFSFETVVEQQGLGGAGRSANNRLTTVHGDVSGRHWTWIKKTATRRNCYSKSVFGQQGTGQNWGRVHQGSFLHSSPLQSAKTTGCCWEEGNKSALSGFPPLAADGICPWCWTWNHNKELVKLQTLVFLWTFGILLF